MWIPPDDVAPMVMGGLCMLTPIVAILAWHQQRMARFIHGESGSVEASRLRQELAEMRDRMNEQALLLEDLRSQNRALLGSAARSEEQPARPL